MSEEESADGATTEELAALIQEKLWFEEKTVSGAAT